jgi:GTPase KRas protein
VVTVSNPRVQCLEGRDLAQRFGFSFLETSARLRINVDETFVEIVREIKRHNKVRQEQNTGGKPSRKGSLMGSPHHVPMMDTQTEGGHHDGCCSRCVLA